MTATAAEWTPTNRVNNVINCVTEGRTVMMSILKMMNSANQNRDRHVLRTYSQADLDALRKFASNLESLDYMVRTDWTQEATTDTDKRRRERPEDWQIIPPGQKGAHEKQVFQKFVEGELTLHQNKHPQSKQPANPMRAATAASQLSGIPFKLWFFTYRSGNDQSKDGILPKKPKIKYGSEENA